MARNNETLKNSTATPKVLTSAHTKQMCNFCGKDQLLACFGKDATKKLGVRNKCRDCHAQYLRDRREKHKLQPATTEPFACSTCKVVLPVDAYARNAGNKLGYSNICKSCAKPYNQHQSFKRYSVRRRRKQTTLVQRFCTRYGCSVCAYKENGAALNLYSPTTNKHISTVGSIDNLKKDIRSYTIRCHNCQAIHLDSIPRPGERETSTHNPFVR